MKEKESVKMKKRIISRLLSSVLALSVFMALTGCDGNINININNVPSSAQEEAPAAEDTEEADKADEEDKADDAAEQASEEKEYVSDRGWSVKYDPSIITVNEGEDMTSFVYTGESAGTNMLTISYIADKLPDEVLSELTEGWGDPGSVESSESYFPGTSDKWGLWRTLLSNGEGSELSENVFAGEYNGGVLMFDFTTHKAEDDSIDIPVSDALSAVIDSIKYEDFGPQTMYEDYPGVYKMEETEEIEGEEMTYEYSITLNEDHSGVISIQDDINMMWGSNLLIGADFSYDYSVDGDKLTVDMDGNQLTFTR